MKLNKVNKNGSLSVILPKSITEDMQWQQGDEVQITINTKDTVLITSKTQTITLEQLKNHLQSVLNLYDQLNDVYGDKNIQLDRQAVAKLLKTELLVALTSQIQ